MDYLEILYRSIISIAFIFIITKLLGPKQVSQLTFFDYVVGITLGSLSASLAIDNSLPIGYGLIAISVYAIFSLLSSLLSRKSMSARRWLEGNPHILISKGKILGKELKRSQFTVNDLLRELRTKGYFNLSDVNHALLETNGKLSVQPKSAKRPVYTEDMNLHLQDQGLCANVVIDGNVMQRNLAQMGKDTAWLANELKRQEVRVQDILLATLDTSDQLSVYQKNELDSKKTILH
ncbi:MAG: DUF421 domain-containing protein [Clostridia bacterium]|nr:DUF421 domain-containing protein [Clostridia bacterium]